MYEDFGKFFNGDMDDEEFRKEFIKLMNQRHIKRLVPFFVVFPWPRGRRYYYLCTRLLKVFRDNQDFMIE